MYRLRSIQKEKVQTGKIDIVRLATIQKYATTSMNKCSINS